MSVPDAPKVCVGCWSFRPTLTEGFVPDVVGFFGKPINLCGECMKLRERPMPRSLKSDLRAQAKKPRAESVVAKRRERRRG